MNTSYPLGNFSVLGFSDPFSSITHLLGAVLFLILGIVLVRRQRGGMGQALAVSVFVFGVVFLLAMSGVFHLLTPGTTGRAVLQRLDHAGIFFLIAATFTPLQSIHFRGALRWGMLGFIWSAAIVGIVLKSIFFNDIPEWVSLSLYLILGWTGAFSTYFLYRHFGLEQIKLILTGAAAYSIGAVLEFFRFPILIHAVIGPHELFHVLVLSGISAHWVYIANIATAPVFRTIEKKSPLGTKLVDSAQSIG